jgi:hypothetical protein
MTTNTNNNNNTIDRDSLIGTILEGFAILQQKTGGTFDLEQQQEIMRLSDEQPTEKLVMMANSFTKFMETHKPNN